MQNGSAALVRPRHELLREVVAERRPVLRRVQKVVKATARSPRLDDGDASIRRTAHCTVVGCHHRGISHRSQKETREVEWRHGPVGPHQLLGEVRESATIDGRWRRWPSGCVEPSGGLADTVLRLLHHAVVGILPCLHGSQ